MKKTLIILKFSSQKTFRKKALIFMVLMFFILPILDCQNTMPVTWKNLSTLIQCNHVIVPSISNATVPSPSIFYNISLSTLNNLTNRYPPAVGFTDLKYDFNSAVTQSVGIRSYYYTATAIRIEVWAYNASGYLHRWEINYLAISSDFQDFFIFITFKPCFINRQINSSSPFVQPGTLSSALPSTLINNIKTIVSINLFYLKILQGSNLFSLKGTVDIINSTDYNINVISNLSRTYVSGFYLNVIFYQQNSQKNQIMLQFYISFSYGSAQSLTNPVVNQSHLLANSSDPFYVQHKNKKTFLALSSVAFKSSIDFTLILTSNSSIDISFTQAQQIKGTFLFFSSALIPFCPSNYIYSKISTLCICNYTNCYGSLCAVACFNCTEFSANCTPCLSNAYFINETCYDPCPLYYFGNVTTGLCQVCGTNCLICSSASLCLNCSNQTFLSNGYCVNPCPITQFGNTTTQSCQVCGSNCLECLSYAVCLSCANNSFLFQGLCLSSCPNTTYQNYFSKICQNCSEPCQTCQSITNCTSCKNMTYFLNFKCYVSCPLGYYGDSTNNSCIKCSTYQCSVCTAIICLQCFNPYFLSPTQNKCSKQCPPNYFPNKNTQKCQKIQIIGCVSGLFINNTSICLQCNVSLNYMYNPNSRSCICKKGYHFKNGACTEICGDGILNKMECDDGNVLSGDGCDSSCIIQRYFSCKSVQNGPTLTSKCTYLQNINISILSEIKLKGENTMKLTLNIEPAPSALTPIQIKKFLNMQIDSSAININNIQISFENGIAQLFIPYNQTIQGKKLKIWTNFDQNKFTSSNVNISSILKGDTVSLIYSDNWHLYENLAIFAFSITIFVCVFGLLSLYKHKMIGLQLILPIQVIFYSQSFYISKAIQSTIYIAFKPISFSVLTPDQIDSKNNSLFIIGMVGGFLQNYNLLGILFFVSAIFLIIQSFKLQKGQKNRFRHKKSIKDWVKFGQFKNLIKSYQRVIWKLFFPFFCISTIPLIFALPSKALTQIVSFKFQSIFDIINARLTFIFTILFMFGIFYTSIPLIWYNNGKNFLKKHIFKQQCQHFEFEAKYCMYFQLHYLFLGIVFAFVSQTNLVLYVLSGVNGLFTIFVIIKRPYQEIIDNVGAILSCLIIFYYLTANLLSNIPQTYQISLKFSHLSGFIIISLIFIQICVAFIRFFVFWKKEAVKQSSNSKTKVDKKFKYVRDEAFNKFTRQTNNQNVEFEENQQRKQLLIKHQIVPFKIQQMRINQEDNRGKQYIKVKKTIPKIKN